MDLGSALARQQKAHLSTTIKTTAGVSPSMPVFGSRFSGPRFDASRSRLDVTRDESRVESGKSIKNLIKIYIYIYIYIYMDFADIDPTRTGELETRPRRHKT